jgi:HAD superfamily hydrolase (TIGR01549 family)
MRPIEKGWIPSVLPEGAAITFDFHNTLVHCDEWFTLEIRTLVSEFLRWQARARSEEITPEQAATADAAYRALRLDIQDHGNEQSAEECIATVLPQLGATATDDEIEQGVVTIMRATLDQATPVPCAPTVIEALHRAGARLGIVSSAVYHPFLVWALDRFGMLNSFQVVTTSASAGFYKSRPEIYWSTLSQLNAEARRSIHIGDSLRYDVDGAKRAGMRAVWFNNRAEKLTNGERPDLTLTSFHDAAPAILDFLTSGSS